MYNQNEQSRNDPPITNYKTALSYDLSFRDNIANKVVM